MHTVWFFFNMAHCRFLMVMTKKIVTGYFNLHGKSTEFSLYALQLRAERHSGNYSIIIILIPAYIVIQITLFRNNFIF